MPPSAVSCADFTLSRIHDLEPSAPIVRYEHAAPGDLLHLDIKKIGRFQAVGCRITGNRRAASIAPAGSMRMSPLTTTPASPSPQISCPTRKPRQPPLSCRPRLTTMLDSASPSPACSPITVPAIAPAIFANSASSSVFTSASLVLTLHAPTVRPNASSRPLSGNGPTAVLTDNSQARALELPRWLHQYNWHRPHASLDHARPLAVPVSTGTTC